MASLPSLPPDVLKKACNGDEILFKEVFRKFLLDVNHGDVTKFNECMSKFGNIKAGEVGVTSLHTTPCYGMTSSCKYLIENSGFDVNLEDVNGTTPLHVAIKYDNAETAAYLIEKGADVTKSDEMGRTPLHFAAMAGRTELMQLLISNGADVNSASNSRTGTPLHRAITANEKDAVRLLLEHQANPNYASGGFETPLHLSIMINSSEFVKMLLEAGADPNTIVRGISPLGRAATWGKTEIAKYLLSAGANPNHIDVCGFTPFENAMHHSHLEYVEILFPVTSPISSFAEWNLSAILLQLTSDEFKSQRELIMKEVFEKMKSEGDNAFKRKDYYHAVTWYTQAMNSCPSEASVWSNRSLCWIYLNDGGRALSDALGCVRLRPDWPKAHYREGVAWKLIENYPKAKEAFHRALKLDPDNKQIQMALNYVSPSVIEEQTNQGTEN